MDIRVIPPVQYFFAKDLDDAYNKGFFVSVMTKSELIERITKYNPSIAAKSNATHTGLFDLSLNEDHRFICGIPHINSVPKYSILKFDTDKQKKLEERDIYGDVIHSDIVDTDDETHKMLIRGWSVILKIVEARGYKIDKRGI